MSQRETLERDGMYVTTAQEVWPNMIADMACVRADATAFAASPLIDRARTAIRTGTELPGYQKPHMIKQRSRIAGAFTHSPHIVRLAETLVTQATDYFGEPALLWRADTHVTLPMRKGEPRVLSQQWHRDYESPTFFKVLWFITDITSENGQFEYLIGTSRGRRLDLCPQQDYQLVKIGQYGNIPRLGLGKINKDDAAVVTGPPDTVIVVDTSGIHRGGYARSDMRVHVMFTYVPTSGGQTTTIEKVAPQ